jgi:hypothetical protein
VLWLLERRPHQMVDLLLQVLLQDVPQVLVLP